MKRVYILLIIYGLAVGSWAQMQQEVGNHAIDSISARIIIARVDSIFNQLGEKEKSFMKYHYTEDEYHYHFIKAALNDWRLYSFLLERFGEEIMDVYLKPDNVGEVGIHSDSSYPLDMNHDYRSGSFVFYHAMMRLTSNNCAFYRLELNKDILDNRDIYKRRAYKAYDVAHLRSIAEQFRYPDAFSYLALKDDSLKTDEMDWRDKCDWRLEKAEALLAEKQRTIGPHHPCYALTLSDMATMYCMNNCQDFHKAILLQRKALDIYRKSCDSTVCQLAARHLSHIYYLQKEKIWEMINSKKPFTSYEKYMALNKQEIETIEPILGSKSLEVKFAHNELKKWEFRRQQAMFTQTWTRMDSIYNEMSPEERDRVKELLLRDRLSTVYERDNHFVRAVMVERQILDDIDRTFGKGICDSLLPLTNKFWWVQRSEYEVKISSEIHKLFQDVILKNNSYTVYRIGNNGIGNNVIDEKRKKQYVGETVKQYQVLDAHPITEAHRYPKRFSYFVAKDDSLVRFIKNHTTEHALTLAQRLVNEKLKVFGKKHPIYALALSDLAEVYLKRIQHTDKEREQYYREATALQTQAIKIYQHAHMEQCARLAAKFYSHICDFMTSSSSSKAKEQVDSMANLKRNELSIIEPILGDDAIEVIATKAELQQTQNYLADLKARRHEIGEFSWEFREGVKSFQRGDFKDALEYFIRIENEEKLDFLSIREKYARQWMAACYLHMGDTVQASKQDSYYMLPPIDRRKTLELDYLCTYEPDNPQFLQIVGDSLGIGTLEYARMLLMASEVLVNNKHFLLAADYLQQAKTICNEKLTDDGSTNEMILNQLGSLYKSIDYYQEAVLAFEESAELQRYRNAQLTPDYQSTLSQIIDISNTLKDTPRIIRWSKEKLETDTTSNMEARYGLMEKLASVLAAKKADGVNDTVSVREAVGYLQQAIALRTGELEKKYPLGLNENDERQYDYIYDRGKMANVMSDLIGYYYILGDTAEAMRLDKQSVGWLLDYKTSHPGNDFVFKNVFDIAAYHRVLSNLAIFFYRMAIVHQNGKNFQRESEVIDLAKKFNEEDKYYVEILWHEKSPIYNSIDYIIDIFKGLLLSGLNQYDESTTTLKKAMYLREEMDGGRKKMYYSPARFLVQNFNHLGRFDESVAFLKEWWLFKSNAVLQELVLKNGPQREQYWDGQKSSFESDIPRLALQTKQPEAIPLLYDNALLTKGLLLNTEMEIDRLIIGNSTTDQMDTYQQLRHNQLLLTEEMLKPKINRTVNVDSLQLVVRTQEHALLGTIQQNNCSDIINELRVSWTEVQQHLRTGDVAIEFITVPVNKDSMLFCALTLRNGYDQPHLTKLFTLEELKLIDKTEYYGSTRLYDILWRPLQQELEGVENIYFSPISALHQIGIEYLPGMEHYNTYRLSSTRELLSKRSNKSFTMEAALYGGLKFELTSSERTALNHQKQNDGVTAFRDVPDLVTLRAQRGAEPDMPVLEGSVREVHDIDSLMRHQNIPVTTAMGTFGTEESFKALSGQHKSIIHVSTHGFYQPEEQQDQVNDDLSSLFSSGQQAQTREDRSLSRSGLLMTGAADFIFGRIPVGDADDGILTAREISRLDLNGLELVVLSACETGLGDISGEGVFGLQRGFKKAGAQTLLVSLWKVEDDATQLLMTEFYRNLLSGMTRREAFLKAQQQLRLAEDGRFNRYECWASFVMIDGLN